MSLPLRTKLLYATSNLGSEALARTRSLWLLYYYAPPADAGLPQLLPTIVVGALLAVGAIAASLNEVVVGYVSDRWTSRIGRRLPFILTGAPPAALFAVLLFVPPADAGTATTALYLFVALELMFLCSRSPERRTTHCFPSLPRRVGSGSASRRSRSTSASPARWSVSSAAT